MTSRTLDEIVPNAKYLCSSCGNRKRGSKFTRSVDYCDPCIKDHGWRECIACGSEFIAADKRRKWCSPSCSPYSVAGAFLIFERDDFRCIYCGKSSIEDASELHVDHIVPVAANGSSRASNLVTACARCNLEKSDKVLSESSTERITKVVAKRNRDKGVSPKRLIKVR